MPGAPPEALLVSGRSPPPWLFGITNIPFGVSGGYTSVAMPFILHQAGLPVGTIATVSAAVLIPLSYQFLWAPMLDVGLRRRTWLILAAALGALLLAASLFLRLPSQLLPFEICCVVGQGLTGLVSCCNGALISTTVPAQFHGRTSGWLNAANLGGNAVGGGLVLGIVHLYSLQAAGIALGVLSFIPALAVLAIDEREHQRGGLTQRVGAMLRDVWATATSRPGWTGILFCIAPVSTPALLDLFSAIGDDFHTSGRTVEYTMGYGSGLLTALGALLAGRVLDHVDRRRAYLFSGALIALIDIAMAYAPQTPLTYIIGTSVYSLASGLCFAAFSAMVLEIVAGAGRSAATQYSLFDAAGNLATSYLAWADGAGYDFFKHRQLSGASGMLLTDASMNLIGLCALLLLMFAITVKPRRQ